MIPVVSHYKKRIFRHNNRSEIIPGLYTSRNNIGICMNTIIVIKALVVNIDLFVTALNHITGNPDYPLDKILVRVFRKFKNDNIATFRIFDGNNCGHQKRQLDPVNKFIHQNVVPDLKSLLHGT